jgi:hypothetical protein
VFGELFWEMFWEKCSEKSVLRKKCSEKNVLRKMFGEMFGEKCSEKCSGAPKGVRFPHICMKMSVSMQFSQIVSLLEVKRYLLEQVKLKQ